MFNLFKKNETEKKDNLSLIEIASLLIHSAKIDENFTDKEREIIKNALIDDCMLARRVKKNGHKTWIGLTHSAISIRQYEKFSEISQLVTRTAYTQLRYSPILLLICMLIMSIAFIIPLIAILQDGSVMLMGLATFFIQIICYFPIIKYYSMNPLYALSLSFIGILYMLFTLNSSYHYYFNKGASWKKRYYKN